MSSLYLHIPFCSQRCVYCDFYFTTTRQSHASFVQALRTELEYYAAEYGGREPVETIYFGGGTPSLLSLEDLNLILDSIHRHYDASQVKETTLELNPEDVDVEYLRGLRALGVDRLSIGIQSFFSDDLAFMNRSHTAQQADEIIPMAQRAGFDNFTVDLIFGLPDQPMEYWGANVQKAVRLGAPHLSTYGLTIEERTPLFKQVQRGLVAPAPDSVFEDRYQFTMEYLRREGFEHYEISSFARPGFRSQHNQAYWNHANYLGFGPSAHSFWWRGLPAHRWSNERNLRRYETLLAAQRVPLDIKEPLSLDTLADEYIMLRLRTSDGIDLDRLQERYGVDLLYEKPDELTLLESEGFIEPVRNRAVRLTDRGKILCDAITSRLFVDNPLEA